ncbi:hypothetical protein N7533_010780 [Penicillium manginii]|uniref:uncharacterized protein n=1 Tax=Penicillium manginii TaxID=203109 RepID=UPI0025491525|nr:uncharacterized protein N7533_010780 [Penicillium manginii]KAJ5741371.1 hypothetical protein N7533_010780 [Penicillium manginii]
MAAQEDGEDGEDYFLPLEDQSIFGAGIRRKRVQFVRSSEHELNTTTTRPPSSTPSGPSIANAYLSIVLKNQDTESAIHPPNKNKNKNHLPAKHTPHLHPPTHPPPTLRKTTTAKSATSPLSTNPTESPESTDKPHEASLAHQVCLTHSHPPSHLDRTRVGLKYLSTYGWDPDSRRGLGAPGREGIREPLKSRVKNDTAGLGAGLDADGDRIRDPPAPPKKVPVQKLNAKQVRKKQVEERKRGRS